MVHNNAARRVRCWWALVGFSMALRLLRVTQYNPTTLRVPYRAEDVSYQLRLSDVITLSGTKQRASSAAGPLLCVERGFHWELSWGFWGGFALK